MGPANTWEKMKKWLVEIGARYQGVKALLVVSAHWEEDNVTVQSVEKPPLLFDYYGFPKHTYELEWPAPGSPELASHVQELLLQSKIPCKVDGERGFDHGVFVPLKVSFPKANIPTVQLSLNSNLDPGFHFDVGRALSPLREDGVLIIGSGLSFHNQRAMITVSSEAGKKSEEFDSWLGRACRSDPIQRSEILVNWLRAPHSRFCHPREEHLIPLFIAVGAAEKEDGNQIFTDQVMGVKISGFEFGDGKDDVEQP